MFEWITDPQVWITFATLTLLEIILGIDNIIFLSIIVAKVPVHQQNKARKIGLLGAMLMRLGLLVSISWVMHLTEPLFSLGTHAVSARDLILFFGGLFLIIKPIKEILESLTPSEAAVKTKEYSFFAAIVQIMILDIIFSLDSVITAVGLADDLSVMVMAVIIAVMVMMFAAKSIGDFVERHPSIKLLALAFLVLVGFVLVFDSFNIHISKGYLYFAMFFSLLVECLNLLRNKKHAEYQMLKKAMLPKV